MRDRIMIFAGLFVFLTLFTYPVWKGAAARTSTQGPVLQLPVSRQTCVAPVDTMRSAHMQLLIAWRNGAVRENRKNYTAYDGTSYKVSLTNTCLSQCHGSKQQFCDRCHSYVAISTPTCWDCHQDAAAQTANLASAATPGEKR